MFYKERTPERSKIALDSIIYIYHNSCRNGSYLRPRHDFISEGREGQPMKSKEVVLLSNTLEKIDVHKALQSVRENTCLGEVKYAKGICCQLIYCHQLLFFSNSNISTRLREFTFASFPFPKSSSYPQIQHPAELLQHSTHIPASIIPSASLNLLCLH